MLRHEGVAITWHSGHGMEFLAFFLNGIAWRWWEQGAFWGFSSTYLTLPSICVGCDRWFTNSLDTMLS